MAGERKRIDIEKLLRWAYRDELPKQGAAVASSWDAVAGFGERGGIAIDDERPRLPAALGWPHEDAIRIEKTVRALPDYVIDTDDADAAAASWASLWWGWEALAPANWPSLLVAPARTTVLVAMHARMASRPEWSVDRPRPRPVYGPNGKPVHEGLHPNGVPKPGAFCPLVWEPAVETVAIARYDYAAWHDGLRRLAESLTLRDFVVTGPEAPLQPWIDGVPPGPRILADLVAAQRFPRAARRRPKAAFPQGRKRA